jgi:hypothetical protein
MQFSTIILAAFYSLALAAPAPAAEADASAAVEAAIAARQACRDGTYRCGGNNPEVCQFGIWMLAARCGGGQKCVIANGAPYCL